MRSKFRLSLFLVLALVSSTACTATVETEPIDGADPPAGRELIGTWLEDDPSGIRITIYREDGLVFMENIEGDGASETAEMIETTLPRNTQFNYADERSGAFFVISVDGDLNGWTPDGVFPHCTTNRVNAGRTSSVLRQHVL